MRFGKPTKNKRRHNPRYHILTEGARIENNSSKNLHDVQFYLEEFYPFCKKALGFEQDASIVFESDYKNAKDPLGKTAYYDPSASSISVYVDARHPKDIMRSVAHELVHHHQNVRGDLQGTSMEEGYAQNDEHLREMEREAYEKGNLLFRDWEDHKKGGGDESLMARIMEKWGYDSAALTEGGADFEEGQSVTIIASALAVDGEKTGTVVSFDDPAVLIKLDDDQEGKYVPDDKMVKVKKDYVEARVESGFAPEMGASEEETLAEYNGDEFDMESLEREFPWLSKSVKAGEVPADVAAELADEFGSGEEEEEVVMKEADKLAPQGGEDVSVVAGGLAGAYGEVMELTTTTEGEPAVVIYLHKDADQRVMGAKGDEVIAKISDVEVDRGINAPEIEEATMKEAEPDTSQMSKKDFVAHVRQKQAPSRGTSDEESGSVESFNNWLADEESPEHYQRQKDWEPAQSYRGGRVLAYHRQDKGKPVGKYYDVQGDMYVDDSEMDAILPEAATQEGLRETKPKHTQKGDNEMNLEEIVRQAVRKALKEKKYRREDEEEETNEGKAKSTEKHDDDSALKGGQDELPDKLQKGIIDAEEEEEEKEKKNEGKLPPWLEKKEGKEGDDKEVVEEDDDDDDDKKEVDESLDTKGWWDNSLYERLVKNWTK
jgi:hypothetical protein